MSGDIPFNFGDLSNMPNRITDIVIGILISEIIYQIRKKHLFSRKYDIRKQFGWFKIMSHIGSVIVFWTLETRFSKIRLKPLAKICKKMAMRNIESSIETFYKTEPELFMKIGEIIKKLDADYKVYKMTGIKSALLEKYLPNLT